MIKNYFKIAWRNLKKNKVFSFINIFGLSFGLACCMLIALYIYNEFQYDTYHKDAKQLFQVGTTFIRGGKEDRSANTPAPIGLAMKQEFPEVLNETKIMGLFGEDKTLLQYNSPGNGILSFYETGGYLADSNFFRMFTYDFVYGDQLHAFDQPNSMVLSEMIAQKIFGKTDPVNKILKVSSSTNGDRDYKVTGVFRPMGKPTHIDANFFLSFEGGGIEGYLKQSKGGFATDNMFFTYVKLRDGADAKKLEAKFTGFVDKYAGKELRSLGFYKKQFLTSLPDLHLRSNLEHNVTPPGSLLYLYILGSIALFTLILASINFMNLSTARSSKRSAEVGVRKVLGAVRSSLIRQFLGESLFVSMVAFIIALLLVILLMPTFEELANKKLYFSSHDLAMILPSFFLLSVFTGLLAGGYPAFYLSSFKPVMVLKSKFSNSFAAASLRKSLVVFQFIISVILIISSLVINSQMKFLRSSELGFIKDNQLVVPLRSEQAKRSYASLKNQLRENPKIQSVGASLYYPGIFNPQDKSFYRDGQTTKEAKNTRMNVVDDNFLQTLGIKPIAGRIFSSDYPSDTANKIIVNETAIKSYGFKSASDAVGKNVFFDYQDKQYPSQIIGVVKDFHYEDLHLAITPFGFSLNNTSSYNYIVIHTKSKVDESLLRSLQAIWHSQNPDEPFTYSFLDEDFQKNYQAEQRLSALVGYFTLIAIVISCLGLLGLAMFSTEQRTKEIGIRKVLGASVLDIVSLVSQEFLKLVVIAVLIATPIAWIIMNKWLQDFAYRTTPGWEIFVLTFLASVFIAISTISFNAFRAAVSNPINNLRTE